MSSTVDPVSVSASPSESDALQVGDVRNRRYSSTKSLERFSIANDGNDSEPISVVGVEKPHPPGDKKETEESFTDVSGVSSTFCGLRAPYELFGDARTAGERLIAFLITMWERNMIEKVSRGNYRLIPEASNIFAGLPAWMIVLITVGTFLTVWISIVTRDPTFNRINLSTLSLFACFAVSWFIVWLSTGRNLYASYSLVDGLNTITRFTVKLPTSDQYPTTFLQSNLPSSISSSVSTRGSTLNKLMIGISFSLGLGFFLKFIQFETTVDTVIGFGYLTVIATALFENRTFILDDFRPHPINYHRLDEAQLRTIRIKRLDLLNEKTSPIYSSMHYLGVAAYVFVTFVGYSINRYSNGGTTHMNQNAWILSLIGLTMSILFISYNEILSREPVESGFWSVFNCFNNQATYQRNKLRSFTCIGIEFVALTFASLAGVIYSK